MRRALLFLLAMSVVLLAAPAVAQEEELPPGGSFYDDQGSVHEPSIEGLAASGVTRGCHDEDPIFCPDRWVTRGQMAAFLDRALDLPATSTDHFSDVGDSLYETSINRIAEAEITRGCDPPDYDRFCPDEPVTRGEMATFLVRALELPPAEEDSGFTDTDTSVRFTTYHDCCEPRVHNIQLLADTLDGYVVYPGEEFSINDVVGPRTRAKGYVGAPILCSSGYCVGVGGGISQFATTMFNAIFWGGYERLAHRPHSIWIDRYPVGIEATLSYGSLDVAFRNDTVTPVTIRTRHTSTSITVELWGNAGGWEMTGYHPRGARSSVIDIIDNGGSDGRKVEGQVTGSPPGSVRVDRIITQHGESSTQTWYHYYDS